MAGRVPGALESAGSASIGLGLILAVGLLTCCGVRTTSETRPSCPAEDLVLEAVGMQPPSGRELPSEDELSQCLWLVPGDARRIAVAAHWLDEGRTWPREAALLRSFLESEHVGERSLGFEYLVKRALPTDFGDFWGRVEREQDPVVVEQALHVLVASGRFDGDRRVLTELRRVVGVRDGRPMGAVSLLTALIPSAAIDVPFDPPALVAAWRTWLDANAAALRFDDALGVFVLP